MYGPAAQQRLLSRFIPSSPGHQESVCKTRKRSIGTQPFISEGAQVVNRVPEAPLACSGRVTRTIVSIDGRDKVGSSGIREFGRAVKAGRRPPGGEALRARSVACRIMECEARQGFVFVPCVAGPGTRCGPSPEPACAGRQPGFPGAVHLFVRPATWSGSAATRRAQSGPRSRRYAGTMNVAELAPGCVRSGSHPALARQRISPSRRP